MAFKNKAILLFFTALIIAVMLPIAIPIFIALFLFIDWYGKRKSNKPIVTYAYDGFKLSQFRIAKREYLNSNDWFRKRSRRYQKANGNCECCGTNLDLSGYEAHHVRGYDKIPNEPIKDLRALCPDCHQYQHEIEGYPETLDDYMKWDVPTHRRNNNG